MSTYKVAVIVGSNRKGSINRKLAQALVLLGDPEFEFNFIQIDDLPLYNLDLESCRPASVNRFTAQVAAAHAVLIVTPEHNRSLPAVLKNALDWGSKPADQNVWRKPSAITGTSTGGIATALAQGHLRHIMGILGSTVLPGEVYIQFKPELIANDDTITVESTRDFLKNFMDQFAGLVKKLA